jgi:membrane protease YdiL (CAAX protease family)
VEAGRSGDGLAAALRGSGPVGFLAFAAIALGNLLFIPLSALLVLLWAHLARIPWGALGFRRPRSWPRTIVLGVVLGVALKLVMKSVVMPLLGADPINHAYHFLTGNPATLPWALYTFVVGAGFGEETVFRGYLFERLGRLWGTDRGGKTATVIVSSVLFGLAHLSEQGLSGSEQAAIVGLVVGTLVAVTGHLVLPMVLHAAFDLTALAIIYWGLENRVAHWFFR